MKLFEHLVLTETAPRPVTIDTPLGAMTSRVIVNGRPLNGVDCSRFYSLAGGGFAARWDLPAGIAELVVARPILHPLYREQITNCRAFLWRFQALGPIEKLVLESSWADGSSWTTKDGPNPGERLDAQSWHDGDNEVCLGTPGDDALFARSKRDDWLPKRYSMASTYKASSFLDLVRYHDAGLAVDFGEVFRGELFQTHFAIAWAPYIEESIGTWLAVDVAAEDILKGAGEFDSSRI